MQLSTLVVKEGNSLLYLQLVGGNKKYGYHRWLSYCVNAMSFNFLP